MTELNKEKKYIGSCCGNSFVVLDGRNIELDKRLKADFASKNIVKFGVDSALFIGNAKGFNISMEIFEKDGSESESCGNGIILIAYLLGLNKGMVKMKNGTATLEGDSEKQAILMNAKLSHIEEIGGRRDRLFVKMGEPHTIYLVNDLNKFDLVKIGKNLQKNYLGGINVDAIQRISEFHYLIRTYERGVLAETKSCGTGSLSSYIAISYFNDKIYEKPIEFKSAGGSHWVSKNKNMLKLEALKKFCEIRTS